MIKHRQRDILKERVPDLEFIKRIRSLVEGKPKLKNIIYVLKHM